MTVILRYPLTFVAMGRKLKAREVVSQFEICGQIASAITKTKRPDKDITIAQ